jgi:TPR repeat protein
MLSMYKEKKKIKEGSMINKNLPQTAATKVKKLKAQCENGNPDAMYQLGIMYLEAKEVGYDPDLGREYLEASAKKRNFDANYALALYYKGHWSYPHADPEKSHHYYFMASKCTTDDPQYAKEVQRAISEDFESYPDQKNGVLWVFKYDIPIKMR